MAMQNTFESVGPGHVVEIVAERRYSGDAHEPVTIVRIDGREIHNVQWISFEQRPGYAPRLSLTILPEFVVIGPSKCEVRILDPNAKVVPQAYESFVKDMKQLAGVEIRSNQEPKFEGILSGSSLVIKNASKSYPHLPERIVGPDGPDGDTPAIRPASPST